MKHVTSLLAGRSTGLSLFAEGLVMSYAGQLGFWVLGARHEHPVLHRLAPQAGNHTGNTPHDPHMVTPS